MSAPITIACTFDTATRRKDRTIRLGFSSNLEVSTDDYMAMDRQLLTAGWLLWSPNELRLEDIPTKDAPTEQRKSKGQRLRAVYYLWWRKLNPDEDFETWYDRAFEKIMDQIKEKL